MAKVSKNRENESVIITNGRKRYVKRGERDSEVQFPGESTAKQSKNKSANKAKSPVSDEKTDKSERKTNKNEVEEATGEVDEDRQKLISNILNHELYTQHTKGVERTDGIMAEIAELGLISEEVQDKLKGKDLKIETVEDVEKIIDENKE